MWFLEGLIKFIKVYNVFIRNDNLVIDGKVYNLVLKICLI